MKTPVGGKRTPQWIPRCLVYEDGSLKRVAMMCYPGYKGTVQSDAYAAETGVRMPVQDIMKSPVCSICAEKLHRLRKERQGCTE